MSYLLLIVHLVISSIFILIAVSIAILAFNVTNIWALLAVIVIAFIVAYPVSKKIAATMR